MRNLMDYVPKKKQNWVSSFSGDSDGYFLVLKNGYINTHYSSRTIHEDTITDILYEFRHYVEKE